MPNSRYMAIYFVDANSEKKIIRYWIKLREEMNV